MDSDDCLDLCSSFISTITVITLQSLLSVCQLELTICFCYQLAWILDCRHLYVLYSFNCASVLDQVFLRYVNHIALYALCISRNC